MAMAVGVGEEVGTDARHGFSLTAARETQPHQLFGQQEFHVKTWYMGIGGPTRTGGDAEESQTW